MTVSVKDGKIVSFSSLKGCPGNLAAIGKLLPGISQQVFKSPDQSLLFQFH